MSFLSQTITWFCNRSHEPAPATGAMQACRRCSGTDHGWLQAGARLGMRRCGRGRSSKAVQGGMERGEIALPASRHQHPPCHKMHPPPCLPAPPGEQSPHSGIAGCVCIPSMHPWISYVNTCPRSINRVCLSVPRNTIGATGRNYKQFQGFKSKLTITV